VTVFGVLGPNDLFGELAYFAGVSRQADALAESDAKLVRIGAPLIERLLATEPEFAHWLLKSLSNQLRVALDRIEEGRQLPAEQRMVRLLTEMARRDDKAIAVSQQTLGELIGVSRITAGQVLRSLARRGLIRLDYRRVTIPDPDRLAMLL
jgi:CRP-like cAMP-binding protein